MMLPARALYLTLKTGREKLSPVCNSHPVGFPEIDIMNTAGTLDGTDSKILVIDDDQAIRVLLQAVLKRMRFQVELAEDGAAGLEKYRHNGGFDLILLDLMMPRVNGYEFIDRITAEYPDSRPHIIVLTAAGKRGVDKIPPHAFCNSILKPFDLEKFVDMIRDCLGGTHQPQA